MRIAVTGNKGQLVQSLLALGPANNVDVIAVGRPQLDLEDWRSVLPALERCRPDVIVSAAAYTAVDRAEADISTAFAINAFGAGAVAKAAATLGVPVIHISTDYVFAGNGNRPYQEDDPVGPISIYGASKREGEVQVQAATDDHVILRVGWLYSPFGQNFLKTMLDLAARSDQVRVVADQRGGPTSALDLASVIITLARKLVLDRSPSLRGLFHVSPTGNASWSEFAEAIFTTYRTVTGRVVAVIPISASEYPTAAARPMESRLDASKLRHRYGIVLPHWRLSAQEVVELLLQQRVRERLE